MPVDGQIRLGAVQYEQGFDINRVLRLTAEKLRKEGLTLAGVVQRNREASKVCCEHMGLVDLRTGGLIAISQDLGPHAQGCRLDHYKLADVAGIIAGAIASGADLLIINKFGKAESDGNGLLSCITEAIGAGIPILTAVRDPYLEAWQAFHGGLADELPPMAGAVHDWCVSAAGRH